MIEELSKKIITELSAYTKRATDSFMTESSKTLGRRILLISVFLILIFGKVVIITEGNFFGIKIDLDKSNKTILFIVVLVVLAFFTIQYLHDYFHEINKWRLSNSQQNSKIRALIKELELLDQMNSNNLMNALNNNSDEINAFLTKKTEINKIDEAICKYQDYCYHKIKRKFTFRKIVELVPILMLVISIIFAFKFFYTS